MKTLSTETSSLYLKIASMVRKGRSSIVVGAGISTSSGIPDFRSKDGLFREIKETYGYSGEQIFTYSVVHASEEAMKVHLHLMAKLKETLKTTAPTETHRLLAYLQKKHKVSIYTQNIDGLEEKAGIKKDLIYLHGNINTLICTHCKHTTAYTDKLNSQIQATTLVPCPQCTQRKEHREKEKKRSTPVGCLLPNIVLYGDTSDTLSVVKRVCADEENTLLLVMGTSLRVHGVKNLTRELSKSAYKNKGIRVYIGREAPPKSLAPFFDYWVTGNCDDFAKSLLLSLQGSYMLKELYRLSLDSIDGLLGAVRRMSLEAAPKT
ncbi:NAD-dependent histone deacetylase SIR2 [Nematocida displodere]|uniref:NAD-dependent histone deacetylase SIR2 n=1 Tax=Nematocida displodere TaxID=1805483 RepID=A0A177EDX5_9MICR|nr:NAD-dependent histone deacetylase SIR2 [Nematocida displodere]